MRRLDAALVDRLHRLSRADRWGIAAPELAVTLERSAGKLSAFEGADLEE